MNIEKDLFSLKDEGYKEFSAGLIPNIEKDKIIGVRVPVIRNYAKKIKDTREASEFLDILPHKYQDENMLHSLLINEVKEYDRCIKYLDKFLPYVDNWAVCDIIGPKVFKKNKDILVSDIKRWIASDKTYMIRFGIQMLMNLYLDDDFNEEYLNVVASKKSDEYYVNMMIAWFFATALAKRWNESLKYIDKLDDFTFNKTISKACESYRITKEQKEYLKKKKRKVK